jgi:hypothetical protein
MWQLVCEIADILAGLLVNRRFHFVTQRSRFSTIMAKGTSDYNCKKGSRINQ